MQTTYDDLDLATDDLGLIRDAARALVAAQDAGLDIEAITHGVLVSAEGDWTFIDGIGGLA